MPPQDQCHNQGAMEAAMAPEASDDSAEEIIRMEEDPVRYHWHLSLSNHSNIPTDLTRSQRR